MTELKAQRLTAEAFAPFGDVLQFDGRVDKVINQGLCDRLHDRAQIDVSDGRVGISLFDATPRKLPMQLEMVERHPDGSQAFLPLSETPFLVVVAPDEGGSPGAPLAFLTDGTQGVNYHRGTWHGVCTPLHPPGRFAVVDRIGAGDNLEEHWFPAPYTVTR